jgi:drug/metabolite transporter (DMT)-like permease
VAGTAEKQRGIPAISESAPITPPPVAKDPAPSPEPPAGRGAVIGILLMVAAVGFFASMNMFVKLVGPDYHPFEAVFFRNTIAVILLVPLILFSGGLGTLKTRRPVEHALRSVVGVISNGCFFYAFQRIPLADGMAIAMAVPIFATLFAIPALGERVGWHRWAAILVGFGGVLVALDPTGAIQTGSLFALGGTLGWAITIVFMRSLGTTESPYTIVFYYMVTGAVVATCFLPWVWVTPSRDVLVLYLCAGIVGAVGQIAMTYALKMAPASVVSPFEYTQIAWAVLFDMTLWGVAPSATTMAGAGIVILTGLYIFRREARARQ